MEAKYYRSLAVEVERFIAQGQRQLLITSSGPGEGKTTVTAELGRALARSGSASVVLVDTDHLRPGLHRLFGLQNTHGLGELLKEIHLFDPRRGDARQLGVGDWLDLLQMQSRSGRLAISEERESIVLLLHKGAVVSVTEDDPPEDRRLGSLLVSRACLTPPQRDNAQRIHEQSRRPLGNILLNLGYVQPEDLRGALHIQFTERLRRMVAMRSPACVFAESDAAAASGDHVPYADGDSIDAYVDRQIGDYLRRPFLAARITEYLTDTQLDNLKVLASGTVPYDLIESTCMAPFTRVLRHLSRAFDVVLIDSPPVAVASPAEALAQRADGVLLVVKAEGFEIQIIQRAKEQLEKRGARLLGAVLNQVDLRQTTPPMYYYYSYHG